MKKTFVWLLATLLFTMVGCVEGLHESGMTETSSEQLPDLTAGFAEGETRTYVESGKYLRWHEDDRLTAFYGNTLNRQYKFNGATGDNSGSFSYVSSGNLETGNALDRIYAVYPYDETITITYDGKISLALPAVQTYAENSFGRGANTMLAATENVEDTFLGFKNACGYLKLKLYNPEGATIKSVEVKGNGDEKIAGAATATIALGEAPQLTMSDNATTIITLDCGKGVELSNDAESPTVFWLVLPATTFVDGITITVTDVDGRVFEKSTSKSVAIERNAIQPMAALEVIFTKLQPKNEIWYTSTDGEVVMPNTTDVFGANIVSNIYEDGKGIIKFNAPITSIGEYAFYNRKRLASVTIPDGVTSIGKDAFRECSSLTSVTIPDSLTWIGADAFSGCSSLTSVYISDVAAWCYIYFASSKSNPLYYAHNLYLNNRLVTDLIIPDSVTMIEQEAFVNCSSLTSVTIGKGVTEIGRAAFYGCKGKLIINSRRVVEGNYTKFGYPSSEDGWLSGAMFTSVTIGNGITAIGEYVFYNYSSLTSVTIPNSVTKIGYRSFEGCSNLTDVYISDIAAWCNITFSLGTNPLGYAQNLYLNNELVTNLTIPDSVTLIQRYAFKCYSKLTSVTIPGSVTTIGAYAFSGCYHLDSATIGSGVTKIGDCAFYGCDYLDSVIIPNSVTYIGDSAFYGCNNLESVTIGNGIEEIGDEAFRNCIRLEEVYCKAITPPSLGLYVFADNNASGSRYIYVPSASLSTYKNASGWSGYKSSIRSYDF